MNVRLPETLEWVEHGQQPLRIILDSELKMSFDAKILSLPGGVIIFHASEDEDKKNNLTNIGVEMVSVEAKKGQEFLEYVLGYLAREKETNEVLLETGSNLSGEMLQAGFIDELIIYLAPSLLGQDAKGLFQLPMIENMSDRFSLNF